MNVTMAPGLVSAECSFSRLMRVVAIVKPLESPGSLAIVQHGQGAGSALQQRVHAHEVADHLDTKVCVTYAAGPPG